MMKRWISAFMAMFMVLSMCAPVAWASPIQVIVYKAPTNLRWDDSYKMHWDWTNTASGYPFEGFQVILYYSATDIPTTSMEGWQQKGHRSFWESGLPSLGDFSVTQPGYYAFQVYAYGYGEELNPDYDPANPNSNQWNYYEYVSPVSDMSRSIYFAANAKPLDEPTELRWEGGTLTWDYGDISGLSFFEIQTEYFEPGANSSSAGTKYTIPTDQKSFTLDSHVLRMGAGTYYVNVRALSANFAVATDSAWVRSEGLEWDGATDKLAPPANLQWNGRTMTWSDCGQFVDHYEVEVYYSETPELTLPDDSAEATEIWWAENYMGSYDTEKNTLDLPNDRLKYDRDTDTYSPGYYFFRVQAYSNSYFDADNSEQSGLSSASALIEGPLTISVPTVAWDGEYMTWNWNGPAEEKAYFDGFNVYIYYQADEQSEPKQIMDFFTPDAEKYNSWKWNAEADGLYFFKVQTFADGLYAPSAFVTSEFYKYELPPALPAPSAPIWSGSMPSWTAADLAAGVGAGYYLQLYYCGTNGTAEPSLVWGSSVESDSTVSYLEADAFGERGAGYYKFRVRTNSHDPETASNSQWSDYSAAYHYDPANAVVLDAPANLRWEGQTMKWDIPEDTTGIYGYELQWFIPGQDSYRRERFSIGSFYTLPRWEMEDWGDNINFRVRALSRDINSYSDSAWAECTKTYEKPDGLPVPTDLKWSGTTMTWSWDGNAADLEDYQVRILYSATEDGEPEERDTYWAEEPVLELRQWATVIEDSGYYYFQVRAFSNNEKIMDSAWSEMSGPLYYEVANRLPAPSAPIWDGSVCTWTSSGIEDEYAYDGYRVELYYRDNGEDILVDFDDAYDECKVVFRSNTFRNYGEGEYFFRVCTLSYEPETYGNSVYVTSKPFTYTGAANDLPAPTGLRWEGTTMKWDVPKDGSVAAYRARVFSAENPDTWSSRYVMAGEFPTLTQNNIDRYGDNINFQVQAFPHNVNEYNDSDWSVVCTDTYTPADPLPTPTDLSITADSLSWNWDGTYSALSGYDIVLYYAASQTDKPVEVATLWRNRNGTTYNGWRDEEGVNATGWYSFRVMAESRNLALGADSEWSALSAPYYYEMADPLPAPTNVTLVGTSVQWTAIPENKYFDNYVVELYAKDPDGNVHFITSAWASSNPDYTSYAFSSEEYEDWDGYEFFFTVSARSKDLDNASHSQSVSTDTFTYVEADTLLDAPKDLHWEGTCPVWEVDEGAALYEVELYAADDQKDTDHWIVWPGTFPAPDPEWLLDRFGEEVYFRVRAISANANEFGDSEWITLEETFELSTLPDPTNVTVDGGVVSWDWKGDYDLLDSFYLQIYYSATQDGPLERVTSWYTMDLEIEDWRENASQSGWYTFKIQARSCEPAESYHSDWVTTKPYQYTLAQRLPQPADVTLDGTTIRWDRAADEAGLSHYRVELYYQDPESGNWWKQGGRGDGSQDFCSYAFPIEHYESRGSGKYKITVTAISDDYDLYADSLPVELEFDYVRPAAQLDAPTNLRWDGLTMKWDVPADTSAIHHYEIRYFNINDPENWYRDDVTPGEFPALYSWRIENLGYPISFYVMAVAKDANAYRDGISANCSTYFTGENAVMPKITGLNFSHTTGQLTWDHIDNHNDYEVELWYASTLNGVRKQVMTNYCWGNYFLMPSVPEEFGLGWYFFKVRALGEGYLIGDGEWTEVSTQFTQKTKLGTPTDLQWHIDYEYRHYNGVALAPTRNTVMGNISWLRGLDQAHYNICIYRVNADGEDKLVNDANWRFGSTNWEPYLDIQDFLLAYPQFESGTYYFTVQALGDGVLYTDGDIAKSGNWTYVNPEEELEPLTGLRWDGRNMTWDRPDDLSGIYGVEVQIYYSATKDGEMDSLGGMWSTQYQTEFELDDERLMEYGNGFYWFEARLISKDVTKATASEWVLVEEPYDTRPVTDKVNEKLDDAMTALPTVEENKDYTEEEVKAVETAVEAVQKMDTQELATAMAADTSHSNKPSDPSEPTPPAVESTLDKIIQLEETLKATNNVTSEVKIDPNDHVIASTFDTSKVEIVGAALNADTNGGSANLKISEPDQEAHTIPTQYFNTVQFSMKLTDADGMDSTLDADPTTDGQQLAVPVRITLPVPGHINPAFLVVLHHIESTNTYEELRPHLELGADGTWYASFVVTSFSDFALASVTMEAETSKEGVSITAIFSADMTGRALCAVYDVNGRQLGLIELNEEDMSKGEHDLFIPCKGEDAHTIKLFQLGTDLDPQYGEMSFDIEPVTMMAF